MKKITLQWRITLLTAIVLVICSVALTALSMLNAQRGFYQLLDDQYATQGVPAIQATVPENLADADAGTLAIQATQQFNFKSVLFCLLATIIGTCATYFIAGQALKPLRNLSDEIERIDENSLSAQLPPTSTQDEIGRLTDNFNKMLSRLEDAFIRQKRFTANAAHELKTPLATLKTGAQVLEADKNALLPDYQENMQMTLISVDRLSKIVDDLLLLASNGETTGEDSEEVLLGPLFDAIESELSLQRSSRHIDFQVDCGNLCVHGNSSLLYRSFFNLIENACKHGKEGGHIWVSAAAGADGIAISIKDDGPGISSEHLPYIFDAFYRVDKSRSREVGGSGLGLSIVKTMIEAYGGTISVESDGKSGTMFTVTLQK